MQLDLSATDYVSLATVLMLDNDRSALPQNRSELASSFTQFYSYGLEDAYLNRIIKQLEIWGALTRSDDRYAGETLFIFRDDVRGVVAELRTNGFGNLISQANYTGASWFRKVFDNQNFWTDLHRESGKQLRNLSSAVETSVFNVIPASDRVVLRSDNQEAVSELEGEIRRIGYLLRADNEVGDELGDDRDIIQLEVEVAEEVLSKPRFRLSSLIGWITPALKFLADRFVGGAIGEAAKRLMTLLVGLI